MQDDGRAVLRHQSFRAARTPFGAELVLDGVGRREDVADTGARLDMLRRGVGAGLALFVVGGEHEDGADDAAPLELVECACCEVAKLLFWRRVVRAHYTLDGQHWITTLGVVDDWNRTQTAMLTASAISPVDEDDDDE